MVPIGRTVLRQACRRHRRVAAVVAGPRGALGDRQPVAERAAEPDGRRRGRGDPREDEDRAPIADARDHRERRDARPRGDDRDAARPAAARACGSRSTTSAPATRRSATCASSRSTSSRSPSRSSTTSAPRRPTRPSWRRSSALARALDLTVVVEGIETAEQAATLHRLGCGLGQGYHFARPLDRGGGLAAPERPSARAPYPRSPRPDRGLTPYSIERIRARQERFGAATSTSSPALRPSSALPSGDSGETPSTLEICTRSVSPCSSSSSTVEPTPTSPLAAAFASSTTTEPASRSRRRLMRLLEQALLVLRRVVLEVLGEVAEAAGGRDRLDDLLAPRALELGQLGLELRLLGRVSWSDFSSATAGG